MARGGLSATRATEIIDFLASRGTTPFTLSELARELSINVASLHAILLALTRTGHLSRHPLHKTFTLGPALVAIGNVALKNHDLIARAEAAAEELSRGEDIEVLLTLRAGDSVLGLAHFLPSRMSKSPLRTGQRLPLQMPYGATFVAWESDEEIERWMHRGVSERLAPQVVKRLRNYLALIRQRGYQITLQQDARLDLMPADESWEPDHYVHQASMRLHEIEENFQLMFFDPLAPAESDAYEVEFMTVPLFDAHHKARYAVTLYGFTRKLSAGRIRDLLSRLLAMSAAIRRDS